MSQRFKTSVWVGATFALLLSARQPAAQTPQPSPDDVRARYTKYEYLVPMRDGAKLFTSIYAPKDTSQKYPFLLTRTPYSVGRERVVVPSPARRGVERSVQDRTI
jgi:predicted acyl esterase